MSTVRIDPKRWGLLKKLEVNLTAQKNEIVRKSEIINYLIDEASKNLGYDSQSQNFLIQSKKPN